MNVDAILRPFAEHEVDAILIGGMNFLLRHQPVLTFDLDLWVRDEEENLLRVARALHDLGAEWGRDDQSWKPVPPEASWLKRQSVFCLTTREGAVDIFREVRGLDGKYAECRQRASPLKTAGGIPFWSLADEDMLACQLVLAPGEQRIERVRYLENIMKEGA